MQVHPLLDTCNTALKACCARHNCLLTTHIGTRHTSLSWGLPNMHQDLWLARPIANQGKKPERTLSFLEKTLGKPITMNTAQSHHIARLYTVQFPLHRFSGEVA